MITKSELSRVAEVKRLSLRNAERDYLLEVLLYSLSEFGRCLVLKGGTALFKFHGLNRFSQDLDFDQLRGLNLLKVSTKAVRDLGALGIPSVVEREVHPAEVNLRFVIKGPLYDGRRESLSRVSVNISRRERPVRVERRLLLSSYPEIPSFECSVLSPEEIAAEKIRGILTRDRPRDVYDLWYLLRKGARPNVSLINRKLRLYGLKYDPGTLERKIEEKRGMWRRDLGGLVLGSLPDFDSVRRELGSALRRLG